MIGIDYNKANVDIRAMFSFTKKNATAAMERLKKIPGIQGCVILSTCNRMELWASTKADWDGTLLEELCKIKEVDPTQYGEYFVQRNEEEAAVERHLGLISSSHLSLNLFVDSGSLCQRLFICPSASPVVYITGTQDKLHQLPDRNLYFFFFHPPTTFHFAYYNSSTCLCLYFRKSKLIHRINY